MSTLLLATDLDGTLVGDRAMLQQFNRLVSSLRSRQKVKLVYVTGRSPESFAELQTTEALLEPDALIAAVGTEIYVDGQKLSDWPHADDWDAQRVRSLLADIPALQLQPPSGQRQYKVGYFLKDNEQALHRTKEALKDYPADVVYCHGIYLDVLPQGGHKGGAIRFLSELWRINANDIITCGDSGNDISMLEDNQAIIVGNAKTELMEWAARFKPAHAYMAKSSFAGGIIEGLKYYKILP